VEMSAYPPMSCVQGYASSVTIPSHFLNGDQSATEANRGIPVHRDGMTPTALFRSGLGDVLRAVILARRRVRHSCRASGGVAVAARPGLRPFALACGVVTGVIAFGADSTAAMLSGNSGVDPLAGRCPNRHNGSDPAGEAAALL